MPTSWQTSKYEQLICCMLPCCVLRSEAANMLADYVGNGEDDSIADADNIPRFVDMMNVKKRNRSHQHRL